MTLAILGSGSAVPDPERGNSSRAVVIDGTTLLFDCGERTTVNLVRVGINPLDADAARYVEPLRSDWSGAGRRSSRRRTLVLTHLGPCTRPDPSVAMASIYYGGARKPQVWDEIVARVRAEFDGEVILSHDALVPEVGGRGQS